jgi:hypothetical protein
MLFHSDVESENDDPRQIDGINVIFYLIDTYDGPWQLISGSHDWSQGFSPSKEKDAELLATHRAQLRTFAMPQGSVVIYNGRGLHRAAPIDDPDFVRYSLFYGIKRDMRTGNQILVDTGFLDNLSEEVSLLLGLGQPSILPAFPQTGAKNLPLRQNPQLLEQLRAAGLAPLAPQPE